MRKLLCFFFLLLSACGANRKSEPNTFKFHIFKSPHSLDTSRLYGGTSAYLFQNIYRSLFKYSHQRTLEPEGAQACNWKTPVELHCKLKKEARFSNGAPILAQHYIQSAHHLFKNKSPHTFLFLKLKNAEDILNNPQKVEQLGIKSPDPHTLIFLLKEPFPNFVFNLTSPAFSPLYSTKFPQKQEAQKLIHFGPYKFKKWDKKGISLIPNAEYFKSMNLPLPPPVDISFIEEDSTALNLFELKQLNLLTRLVTDNISKYINSPQFFTVHVARMDYIGFHEKFKNEPLFRKALSLALNYTELQKLYHAQTPPGCTGLPPSYTDNQEICHKFNLKEAQKIWQQVPDHLKKATYKLGFSKSGGEDIRKAMAWIQYQWQTHLKLKVELQPIEPGSFISTLKNETPDFFRKGLQLKTPSCLSALEVFGSHHPRNLIKYNNIKFQNLLAKLTQQGQDPQTCYTALHTLVLKDTSIIPLGAIYFSMMKDSNFSGFTLNEMNTLDLTRLKQNMPPTQKN